MLFVDRNAEEFAVAARGQGSSEDYCTEQFHHAKMGVVKRVGFETETLR